MYSFLPKDKKTGRACDVIGRNLLAFVQARQQVQESTPL